jgi:hypothetical protein
MPTPADITEETGGNIVLVRLGDQIETVVEKFLLANPVSVPECRTRVVWLLRDQPPRIPAVKAGKRPEGRFLWGPEPPALPTNADRPEGGRCQADQVCRVAPLASGSLGHDGHTWQRDR